LVSTNIGLTDSLFRVKQISAPTALQEIKATSGLTWQQLARVFDVAPRSLHLWMDGEALDSGHEERLYRLLKAVRDLPYATPFQNRTFLLAPRADGTIPFDFLVEGKDEALKTLPEKQPARQITAEERVSDDARKPLPPWILMDALQDRIHADLPGGRSVKTVKRGKPSE
jgi:DNA-binding transcriptional regulator YiaG